MDARDIIDRLDRLDESEHPRNLMASVHGEDLVVTDGQDELELAMPDDRFYLSVAPYAHRTHECYYHSLTTCQGELADEQIEVTIVDQNGRVLVEETTKTFGNGFVGYWLPRDIEGTVRISHGGREGTGAFTTYADSPTCLTTLKLT